MNLLARIVLFVSSYVPLSIMYFLLYVRTNNAVAFISLGVALASVAALCLMLWWWAHDVEATHDQVLEYRKPGAEVMGYVASYLLPFLGFSLDSRRHLLVLAVYLFVLGYLYVTTDMIRVNPTLNIILRRGVYEAKLKEHGSVWLIAGGRIRQNCKIDVVRVKDDLVMQVNKNQEAK